MTDIEALVEAAIKLAAELGPDAFDAIEGRGLFIDRQRIAATITAQAERIEELEKDAERLSALKGGKKVFAGVLAVGEELISQAAALDEARAVMFEVARTVASDTNGTTKGAATSILNARVLPWLNAHPSEKNDD